MAEGAAAGVNLDARSLSSWLRSRAATVHPSLSFVSCRADGTRGVFATDGIPQGACLLRLSREAIISACENGEECDWMPPAARELSPVLRTALFLLRERALGEASEWAPYLRQLPAAYNTLEFWTQEEVEELRGTSVYAEIAALRDRNGDLVSPARVLWEKAILPIVSAAPTLWPDASVDSFLCACAAVRTRGFFDTAEGGGGPYMLPAVDMLNHSRRGTCTSLVVERAEDLSSELAGCASSIPLVGGGVTGGEPSAHDSNSARPRRSSTLVFSMTAEREICAGEELVHTYDHLDNAQLLLTYGFVAAEVEAPLPATARLGVDLLLDACAATRAACYRDAFGPPWDLRAALAEKEAACRRLLEMYGGKVAVSEEEAMPDVLLTVPQLMFMPADDFSELMELHGSDHCCARGMPLSDGACVGLSPGPEAPLSYRGEGRGPSSTTARPPLLDGSALLDEPEFAALVADALVRATTAARDRYAKPSGLSNAFSNMSRRRTAAALREGELNALAASHRQALRLLEGDAWQSSDEQSDAEASSDLLHSLRGESSQEVQPAYCADNCRPAADAAPGERCWVPVDRPGHLDFETLTHGSTDQMRAGENDATCAGLAAGLDRPHSSKRSRKQ